MNSRLTWPQICRSDEFRGRWVALDECKYDARTAQPVEGSVVDADEDLAALWQPHAAERQPPLRHSLLRANGRADAVSRRPPPVSPRGAMH